MSTFLTRPLFIWLLLWAGGGQALWGPRPAAALTMTSEIGPHLFTSTVSWQATRRIYVVAHMTLPADVERVWAVLTDYDNLAEFMPHLDKSEVLLREPERLMLRQEGSVGFPMARLRTAATMEVREDPPPHDQLPGHRGRLPGLRGTVAPSAHARWDRPLL